MKLALTVTFTALVTGCAMDDSDSDLDRTFPDDVEVVIIDPGNFTDEESSADRPRPEYPGDEHSVCVTDDRPNRHELPEVTDRPGCDEFENGSDKLAEPGFSGRAIQIPTSRPWPEREAFPTDGFELANTGEPNQRVMPEQTLDLSPTDEVDDENPCDCDSTECLEDWINRHLGCDVCATFLCGYDERMGACGSC